MNVVTTPTGISLGEITVRESRSASTISEAPASSETGSSPRCPGPISRRTTWGTTRPTKAMMPLTETASAVSTPAVTSSSRLVRSTSTPSSSARFSPCSRMSISRVKNSGATMNGMVTSATRTSGQPLPEKLPMSQ